MIKYTLEIFVLFLLLISCKQGTQTVNDNTLLKSSHSWTYDATQRYPIISAHRGGKNIDNLPENHLETIKYLHKRFPEMTFEIDINASSDGQLFLFHDDVLDHKTDGFGKVKLKTWKELEKIKLKDDQGRLTDFHFTKVEEVLDWADENNVTLWIDFKRSVSYEDMIALIRRYHAPDNVILISYSLAQAKLLHKLAPHMLISVSARNAKEWNKILNSGINLENVIAFTGTILSDKTLFDNIHEKGVKTSLGTLGNLDRQAKSKGMHLYTDWYNLGIDIFSTDEPVALGEYFLD